MKELCAEKKFCLLVKLLSTAKMSNHDQQNTFTLRNTTFIVGCPELKMRLSNPVPEKYSLQSCSVGQTTTKE